MPFCAKCGASVEGRFCPSCGSSMDGAAPPAQAGAGGLTDNVACALCYVLGLVTGIVFLVLAPYNQNKTIRFHAFQAIFAHVAFIIFWIAIVAVNVIMPSFVSLLIGLLSTLVWLAGVVVWILLIVKAYQGQKWVLPVVGPMAEKQA